MDAIARYDSTEMPVYAIKEFKAGPLTYLVWAHNKLALTQSLAKTMTAISAVLRRQPNRASTALNAVAEMISAQKQSVGSLAERYGNGADPDAISADQLRYSFRRRVMTGWAKRRELANDVVCPLDCYPETTPTVTEGNLLTVNSARCNQGSKCAMAEAMKQAPEQIEKLRRAIQAQPCSRENERRARVLKDIGRNPKRPLADESACRALGDAAFAFLCPEDAVILTTNTRDHRPLASALGKTVASP
jgi:hypothetical protein